jgi:hypothetical protein
LHLPRHLPEQQVLPHGPIDMPTRFLGASHTCRDRTARASTPASASYRIKTRYNTKMAKRAVSLTLGESNVLWLQAAAGRRGIRSMSELVDQLITDARAGGAGAAPPQSVIGTIDIDRADPDLEAADLAIRDLFAESLRRPFVVREARTPMRGGRGVKGRRG